MGFEALNSCLEKQAQAVLNQNHLEGICIKLFIGLTANSELEEWGGSAIYHTL